MCKYVDTIPFVLERKAIEGADMGQSFLYKLPILDNKPKGFSVVHLNGKDIIVGFSELDIPEDKEICIYAVPIFAISQSRIFFGDVDFNLVNYYNTYYFRFLEENEEWLKFLEKKAEN